MKKLNEKMNNINKITEENKTLRTKFEDLDKEYKSIILT